MLRFFHPIVILRLKVNGYSDVIISLLAYFRVHGILWLKQSYFSLKLCGNDYFLLVTVLTKFEKLLILKWDMTDLLISWKCRVLVARVILWKFVIFNRFFKYQLHNFYFLSVLNFFMGFDDLNNSPIFNYYSHLKKKTYPQVNWVYIRLKIYRNLICVRSRSTIALCEWVTHILTDCCKGFLNYFQLKARMYWK